MTPLLMTRTSIKRVSRKPWASIVPLLTNAPGPPGVPMVPTPAIVLLTLVSVTPLPMLILSDVDDSVTLPAPVRLTLVPDAASMANVAPAVICRLMAPTLTIDEPTVSVAKSSIVIVPELVSVPESVALTTTSSWPPAELIAERQ